MFIIFQIIAFQCATVISLIYSENTCDLQSKMYKTVLWEKLLQQVQVLLFQKRRTLSPISIAFFKSTQNFAHFEKKDQLQSLNISEVADHDKCGYFNAPKLLFQNTLHQ